MMVVSEEPKLIVSDINIIYKPKPKRAYKSNSKSSPFSHFNRKDFRKEKKQKHKLKKKKENWNLNLDKNGISKSQNFDSISIEEIENDFKKLKARSEIFEVENELLNLLENSTNDTSFNEDERKNKVVERPKNIFYKNLE